MVQRPSTVEEMGELTVFQDIYRGKRVLVTGHTGFKGGWLVLWLKALGAEVCGYALAPNTTPNLFESAHVGQEILSVTGDVRDRALLLKTFQTFKPEIVFHLAAQPLVRTSYDEPVLTYETNVLGTLYVLEAARQTPSVKAVVNVTSDKCYENTETVHNYTEQDPMGGYDMYSSSKGCSEILSSSYRRSFLQRGGYALATARAGNVIGGGDWAADRLVPDCIRSIVAGKPIEIRRPSAVRPWQYVLEPLSGYLLLGQLLYTKGRAYGEGFNFGPEPGTVINVAELAEKIVQAYGQGTVHVHEENGVHEAHLLALSIDKAKNRLGWTPTYDVDTAIKQTVHWYQSFYAGKEDMRALSVAQIHAYQEKISWKKN